MSRNQKKPAFPRVRPGLRLSDGMVAAYLMSDAQGATVRDAAGVQHGSLSGGSWSSSICGPILSFNGSSSYVSLGSTSVFNLTGDFSIALRVRNTVQTAGVNQVLVARRSGVNSYPFSLVLRGGKLRLYTNAGSDAFVESAGSVALGSWSNVLVTRSGTSVCFYIDGQLDAAGAMTLALGASASTASTLIGAEDFGSGPAHYLSGDLDYVYIYARALGAADAQLLNDDPFTFASPLRPKVQPLRVSNTSVAQLVQWIDAAFPDFPRRPTAAGLRLELSLGAGGQYLERDLEAPRSVLHTRIMIRPGNITGGWVTVLRGLTAASAETFRLDVHGNLRIARLRSKWGGEIQATLPTDVQWQCLEARLDATTGDMMLWVNGHLAAAAGSAVLAATRSLRIGGVLKQADVAGTMALDDWIMADAYIGPCVVPPSSAHADDPCRWLIVYNTAAADSVAWAEWYRQQRNIPYANLLGLSLPLDEQVTQADFDTMQAAIEEYLTTNSLAGQVIGILCGHGVPGTFVDDEGKVRSIVSQLQVIEPGVMEATNPLFSSDLNLVRPTADVLAGTRLVSRIDGANLPASRAIVERAFALESSPLSGADAAIFLDPYTLDSSFTTPLAQAMIDWTSSLDAQRLRLPVQLPVGSIGEDAGFNSIANDGFFWGWRDAQPPVGFFGSGGRRVFLTQLDFDDAVVGSLRVADATWARAALDAGYAAVAGAVTSTTPSVTPDIRRFFEALRRGWTIAEAWCVASPTLRTNITLVGDPLMRVTFPQAGWNLYGPYPDWASVDCTQPSVMSRPEERVSVLPSAAEPVDNTSNIFVVRRVDDDGREEAGLRHVNLRREGGSLLRLPPLPVWPARDGWWPQASGGMVAVSVAWPRCFGELLIQRVRLWRQIQGADATLAVETSVASNARSVFMQDGPAVGVCRYRIEVIASSGASQFTPWSEWITMASVPEPMALDVYDGDRP